MAVELTVIVKGEDGALLGGADVTATPGGAAAATNGAGEAVITLDGANRYDVTVSVDDTKETVPYYVVNGQSTARLEVNLQYFKQMKATKAETTQATDTPQPWYQTDAAYIGFGVVAVLLLVLVFVKLLRRHSDGQVAHDGRIYGPDPIEDNEDEAEKPAKTTDEPSTEKVSDTIGTKKAVDLEGVDSLVNELDKLAKPSKKSKTRHSPKRK